MLVIIGILVICGLLAAILFNRLSPIAALILMPVVGALVAGFGLQTATFMVAGISEIAPVAGMFVFAILFFGVMTDAGADIVGNNNTLSRAQERMKRLDIKIPPGWFSIR